MAKSSTLTAAKNAKKDEFYTQYGVIHAEVNEYVAYNRNVFRGKTILLPCDDPETSNFTKFFADKFEEYGLKRLISTTFAPKSKLKQYGVHTDPELFDNKGKQYVFSDEEIAKHKAINPHFDPDKHFTHGRVFVLDSDLNHDGRINWGDIKHSWHYLEGTGDFRSDEVKQLRDAADIIITNPPFSLFREFLAWIMEANKQFLIIGSLNAVTYKEVFPLIKDNKMWLGPTIHSGDREFGVPPEYPLDAAGFRVDEEGNKYIRVKGVRWYTNIDHGTRHDPLQLMTMADNLRYNKKIAANGYPKFDNYDAIEVCVSDGVPSDYEGVMGVPISFLDKYCPEQFVILGVTQRNDDPYKLKRYTTDDYPNANDLNARAVLIINGKPKSTYARILIRKLNP